MNFLIVIKDLNKFHINSLGLHIDPLEPSTKDAHISQEVT